ncbi:MAG: hypothetical protein GY769_07780 [bacterium]|nr:hypothetical protein [bacterium]
MKLQDLCLGKRTSWLTPAVYDSVMENFDEPGMMDARVPIWGDARGFYWHPPDKQDSKGLTWCAMRAIWPPNDLVEAVVMLEEMEDLDLWAKMKSVPRWRRTLGLLITYAARLIFRGYAGRPAGSVRAAPTKKRGRGADGGR